MMKMKHLSQVVNYKNIYVSCRLNFMTIGYGCYGSVEKQRNSQYYILMTFDIILIKIPISLIR